MKKLKNIKINYVELYAYCMIYLKYCKLLQNKKSYGGSSIMSFFNFGSKQTKDSTERIGVSLEKHVENLDRCFVNLEKKTKVNLTKHQARVVAIIDGSGSMERRYRNNEVQETLNRLFPVAYRFDDNQVLDVYVFNENCKKYQGMTLQNYQNYVKKVIGGCPMGGTNYAPFVEQTIRDYDDGSKLPAFCIVITDGENNDRSMADEAFRKSANYRNFYSIFGIGNEDFKYLKKLDDLSGRKVDNTSFIRVSEISKMSDDELYSALMEQYIPWLQAMKLE